VAVAAAGLSPQSSAVTFDDNTKPITFKLTRGQPLKGRVLVDGDQSPIAGATVALLSWAGAPFPNWSTKTDEEGRFSWGAAPNEVATYSISKDGYAPLTPDLEPSLEGPVNIVLAKLGLISGKVVDAQTKEPVRQFNLFVGYIYGGTDANWERQNPIPGGGGKYFYQARQNLGGKIRLLVEAEGYIPAVSPAMVVSGWLTNDFELKKGNAIEGTVKLPDGRPAAGIDVALLTGDYTVLKDQRLSAGGPRHRGQNIVQTDAEGRFVLPMAYGLTVVAAGPPGFAEAKFDEPTSHLALTLQPWGRVEGVVRNGRKPAAHTWVMVSGQQGGGNMQLQYDFESYRTQSDAQGGFVLTNVPPGNRCLVRLYPAGSNRGWMWSHVEPFAVKSGEVTHATAARGKKLSERSFRATLPAFLTGMPDFTISARRCRNPPPLSRRQRRRRLGTIPRKSNRRSPITAIMESSLTPMAPSTSTMCPPANMTCGSNSTNPGRGMS
jgi:hypothetical protein